MHGSCARESHAKIQDPHRCLPGLAHSRALLHWATFYMLQLPALSPGCPPRRVFPSKSEQLQRQRQQQTSATMATDFSRLTVVELRQELKRRNLPQTGKKVDLIDRLTTFDSEQPDSEPRGDGAGNTDDNHEPRGSPPAQDSPAEAEHETNATSPVRAAPVTEDNAQVMNSTTATAEDSNPTFTQTGSVEEAPAPTEAATVTEIITDAVSRKRRSRSPPPENESIRKRARPSDQAGEGAVSESRDTTHLSSDNLAVRDVHSELIDAKIASALPLHPTRTAEAGDGAIRESSYHDQEEKYAAVRSHTQHQSRETTPRRLSMGERPGEVTDVRMVDYDREVAPSQHAATPALYIKNFMRPLREPVLRDYLVELATLPGAASDPDCVVDFYLDQIRTHAYVRFTSISAASRVRTALHGTVWPDERNRKELWVDFIPEDKVVEWTDRELSERGSAGRWEVHYEPDDDGIITARLINAEAEPVRRNSTRQPVAPPPVPTGPARNYPGVEGAPLGPRGRGTNHYRQAPPPPAAGPAPAGSRDLKATRAYPVLQYRPVSEELAQRRLNNMNAHITKDRHRDLGQPDEINRYTFEDGEDFVDRGKEAFIGIRPPHRERERRRLGIGRGNRAQMPAPRRRTPSPRRPARDVDGYRGNNRDDYRDRDDFRDRGGRFRDDVPRSRFNGQPLPTFTGGGRGGRRGGGPRRDRF